MKQRLLSLIGLFLFSILALSAQGIVVTDFYPAENDLTANTHGTIVYDQNGEKCALIKVETTQRGFTFDAGMLGIVKTEQKSGEIWVYVPESVKRLSIFHDDLGVLRDHDLGMSVKKGRTYILKLTTGQVETVVRQAVMSQYLVFTLDPVDALVEVNGEIWNVSEGVAARRVSFGNYNYRIESPDYHPLEGVAVVNNPDQKTEVKVALQPAFGWIEVTGDAALEGASVYIDNRMVGRVPLKSDRLPSGNHNVKVVKPMYKPVEQTLLVSDNATYTYSPQLVPDFAEVQLTTDAAAEIWIDGERKGVGSWSGRLATGEYQIETRRENHRSQSILHRFTPASGVQTLQLSAPSPIYGSVDISVTPGNAAVFMDGVSVGQTPLFMQRVLIGHHSLTLKKSGYGDYHTEVNVTEGQIATVGGKMQDAVEVQYTSNVPGVTLKVDGVEVGPSQGSYSLAYGRHHLEMTAEGYQPFSREIEVSDAARSFALKMESLSGNRTFTVNGVTFTMVAVKGGTFQMGATSEQKKFFKHEQPVHSVTLSDYYIGETEVTQALWTAVMGSNPSYFKGDNLPVEQVSWKDCQKFIEKLNQLTGESFRLPTEAEWEYAARGGNNSRGYQYSGSNSLNDVAWYGRNSGNKTYAVKTKQPNELGIYDMSGNVWEWCQDWYGHYSSSAQTDPQGPSSGSDRVCRGGGRDCFAEDCRVSHRYGPTPDYRFIFLGLRLSVSSHR